MSARTQKKIMPFSSNIKNMVGKYLKISGLILLVLFINACSIDLKKHFSSNETEMARDWPKTDFSKRSFEFDEIVYQALPKDAIPAIDKPVFKKPSDIGWINPDEPVIVIKQGEQAKAYPLQIMIHHEIVNDYIDKSPVVVTFCPLCNAALVFSREVKGQVLDFGTSGSLRKSDLIMYDRQTESWWQQFIGKGIVGHYNSIQLEFIPSKLIAYSDFVKAYPQGEVLSRETGIPDYMARILSGAMTILIHHPFCFLIRTIKDCRRWKEYWLYRRQTSTVFIL